MQSVEKILLSVVSMLAEPNIESPANIEAAVCLESRGRVEGGSREDRGRIEGGSREDRGRIEV